MTLAPASPGESPASPSGGAVAARTPLAVTSALVQVARPRQWIKNLLVFGAPGAAGILLQPHTIVLTFGAFVAFCLAASGTYALNDVMDADADRRHPRKCRRPVASGLLSPVAALSFGAVLMAATPSDAAAVAGGHFAAVVAVYLVITCAYTLRLKHEPIVDLACVSAGFVLRAIGGGVATGVVLSPWFLIVASFGSLLVVTGKRSAEVAALGEAGTQHRKALAAYPLTLLRSIRVIATGITAIAYCLWAFGRSTQRDLGHHLFWVELSVLPFVLALLLLELRFERGEGGAPEDIALGDRTLQVVGAIWLALVAVAVYA